LRLINFEFLQHNRGLASKHPAVPEKIAGFNVSFSSGPVRFFNEALYPQGIIRFTVTPLDAAIPGLRVIRFDPECDYMPLVGKLDGKAQPLVKGFDVADHMVGREKNPNDPVGGCLADVKCDQLALSIVSWFGFVF
jgi:hypothetical protein